MPMIYEPSPAEFGLLVELRNALGAGLTQAGILAAADMIAHKDTPWTFYAGVAAGATAAACGVPGGAATLYVIGDVLDFYLLKSPEGSNVRVFIDGIAYSTIDAYTTATLWEAVQVSLSGDPNTTKRVDIVNDGPSPTHPNPDDSYWFGIRSPLGVSGGSETIVRPDGDHLTQIWTLRLTIEDEKGEDSILSVNFKAPAVINTEADDPLKFAQALGNAVNEMTRGRIVNASISRKVPLLSGWQVPATFDSDVEEKAVFKFNAKGSFGPNWTTTITVPAFEEDFVFVRDGEEEVDFDAAELEHFYNIMVRPYQEDARWNMQPCDARGNGIISLNQAHVAFESRY